MTAYIDEYGRYRYSPTQNTRITVPSYEYWMSVFASAAPTTQTSAAPTTSGTQVSGDPNTDNDPGGADQSGNEEDRQDLPEYDNVEDAWDAVTSTPGVLGPAMITDGVRGRGLFSEEQQPSYMTVGGTLMNPGNPSYADIRAANAYEGGKPAGSANTSMNVAGGVANPELGGRDDPSQSDGISGAVEGGATHGGVEGERGFLAEGGPVGDKMDKHKQGQMALDHIAARAQAALAKNPDERSVEDKQDIETYRMHFGHSKGGPTRGMAEGGEVMFESDEHVPGEVEGPGGPKDDAVPANLSDGEYVNTAEAVNAFGQPFFDQINKIAKMPGAPSLMSNPDFQKTQNEFLSNVSQIAGAPSTGNVPPPGSVPQDMNIAGPSLMSPMGTMPPKDMGSMGEPMGMAEGGQVSRTAPQNPGLMSPMEDFFDWLFEKFSRQRRAGATINADPALPPPNQQAPRSAAPQLEDIPSKAKDVTGQSSQVGDPSLKADPRDRTVTSKPLPPLSLARRVVPAATAFAGTMTPTALNENEDEDLKKAIKAGPFSMKESRTKGDIELPFNTKEEKRRNGSDKPSLAKKPAPTQAKSKQKIKQKETPVAENKLAPDASLGDALEFYKRKGAPGFTFKGETYERSSRSPSGYEQI